MSYSRAKRLIVILIDAGGSSRNSFSPEYATRSLIKEWSDHLRVCVTALHGSPFAHHIVHTCRFSSSWAGKVTDSSWLKWLLVVMSSITLLVAIIVAWVRYRSKVPYLSNYMPGGNHAPKTTEENITDAKKGGEEDDHSAKLTKANMTDAKRGGEDGDYSARGGEEGGHSMNLTEENITEAERGGEEAEHGEKLTKEFAKLSGPKKFSYEELMIATCSFAADKILGKGGFGIVYEGHIRDACTRVAVKIINSDSQQGIKEYMSEVMSLSQVRHKNLVQLIGYCHEVNKFILVYEFMREGSLDEHLFMGRTLLPWERRYNIARGLASAVHYLHEQCDQCVIHRDIKSSNTMLDEKFNAKLGDFGLARLVDHSRGPKTTELIGTPGYLAPECYRTSKASKESDVYSFGVVLLEIACGRSVVGMARGQQGLVEWAWKQYGRRKMLDVMDSRLGRDFDKKEAKALMMAGLWCAHPVASSRPSIEAATAVLHLKARPPNLPTNMPRSQDSIDSKVVSPGCFGL